MSWNLECKIDFYCAVCGSGLCNNTSISDDRHGNNVFKIEPCEKCLAAAQDKGFDEGVRWVER